MAVATLLPDPQDTQMPMTPPPLLDAGSLPDPQDTQMSMTPPPLLDAGSLPDPQDTQMSMTPPPLLDAGSLPDPQDTQMPMTPPAAAPGEATVAGFESNSVTLSPAQQAEWKKFADQYKASGSHEPVMLTGFADTSGNRAKNLSRGNERAKAVQAYLKTQGITAEAESGGIRNPADPHNHENPADRRVTAYIGENAIKAAHAQNEAEAKAAVPGPAARAPNNHPSNHDGRNRANLNKGMAAPPSAPAASSPSSHENTEGYLTALDQGQYPNGFSFETGRAGQSVRVLKSSQGGYSFITTQDGRQAGPSVFNVPKDQAATYLDHLQENPAAFQSTMPTLQAIARHNEEAHSKPSANTASAGTVTLRGHEGAPPIKATPLPRIGMP